VFVCLMQGHVEDIDAHDGAPALRSSPPHTRPTLVEETKDDTRLSQQPASQLVRTEPRYIRLPDVLYNLRHRYPTVTESVFLECTRCHQWVAVPVLRQIPDEVGEDGVAPSAEGLDPIDERTCSHGPLRHTKQDYLHRREQLALEAVTATSHWHSQRLLEKENQHSVSGGVNRRAGVVQGGSTHEGDDNNVSSLSSSSQGMFEQILRHLRQNGKRHATVTSTQEQGRPPAGPMASQPRRHPLLYIPNPDTFVCAGWQCAWDVDALADLRREWLGSIYAVLPMPVVSEEALSSSASSCPSSPSFPATPPPTSREQWQQRKAALNEALAEELRVSRSRRSGRGYGGARLTHFDDHESESSLPPLSLPTQPLATSSQAETTSSRSTDSTTTECAMQLSRMQQSWVKAAALLLLRNGSNAGAGGDEKRMGEEEEHGGGPVRARHRCSPASPLSSGTTEEAGVGPLLSAYCWAVCDACGKLRRVAQPFPGGAPFVCAMVVTRSSSCRAARASTTSASGISAATSTEVENACSVSEVEGLIQCGVKLCEAELITAALSSPFLPYPLRAQLTPLSAITATGSGRERRGASAGDDDAATTPATGTSELLSRADVARVLLAEPLLRTIHASVTDAIVSGTTCPTSPSSRRSSSVKSRRTTTAVANSAQKNTDSKGGSVTGDDGVDAVSIFLQRSLPILRELARTIKKRGMSALVRQILLTPAQIQAKREAVLRNSLLDGYQASSPDASLATETSKTAVKAEAPEEADAKTKDTLVDGVTPRPRTRGDGATSKTKPLSSSTAVAASAAASSGSDVAATAAVSNEGVSTKSTRTARRPGPPPCAKDAAATLSKNTKAPVSQTAVPQQEEPRKRGRGRPPKRPLTTHEAVANEDLKEEGEQTMAVKKERREDGDAAPETRRRRLTSLHPEANKNELRMAAVQSSPPPLQQEKQPRCGAVRPRGRPQAVKKEAADMRNTKNSAPTATVAAEEDDEDEDESDDMWEVVHWVQCDRCSKWRIVPKRVPSRIKFWECKMRYDEERGRQTTCDDPDDADLSS
jgi:hypothetical protein